MPQMLLYLYTLIQNGAERYGNVYPAGVIYSRVVSPSVDETLAAAGAPEYSEPDFAGEVSGIAVKDFDVIFAMDATGSGRYVPAKLDGGAIAAGAKNVLNEEELTELLEQSAHFAAEFAGGIAAGDKRAAPQGPSGHDICQYCDMRDICPRGA